MKIMSKVQSATDTVKKQKGKSFCNIKNILLFNCGDGSNVRVVGRGQRKNNVGTTQYSTRSVGECNRIAA